MTPLEQALGYAEIHQIPIFPCRAKDANLRKKRKSPYTARGFHDASLDPKVIALWWQHWPDALIGMPTGRVSRRWVLDIDVKDDSANGFDSLEDIGPAILPETPMVHTASGRLHVYFDAGDRELRSSAGLIGPGLDVRGERGYVILPSPGSDYWWDLQWNFDTAVPVAAPDWLWPPQPSRAPSTEMAIKPVVGLSPYGKAAIDGAVRAIMNAGHGQQERTLNAECFSIGTLAGAGVVRGDIALRALLFAAQRMPNYDPAWPWRDEEIDSKVRRAFNAGTRHPREARYVA
jgi:hypothetical protein